MKAVALLVISVTAGVAAWYFSTEVLSTSNDAASQVASLAATLAVLLWYAHDTNRLADTAVAQAKAEHDRRESAVRPCVVIEYSAGDNRYLACNIGEGIAINAMYVEDLDAEDLRVTFLGAVRPGSAVELPESLLATFEREASDHEWNRKRHVVLAEPLGGSGKREWAVSLNLVESSHRLSHRIAAHALTEAQVRQIHRQMLSEYVHENWPAIQADLKSKIAELRQSGRETSQQRQQRGEAQG
jgi:hypothetical protein